MVGLKESKTESESNKIQNQDDVGHFFDADDFDF